MMRTTLLLLMGWLACSCSSDPKFRLPHEAAPYDPFYFEDGRLGHVALVINGCDAEQTLDAGDAEVRPGPLPRWPAEGRVVILFEDAEGGELLRHAPPDPFRNRELGKNGRLLRTDPDEAIELLAPANPDVARIRIFRGGTETHRFEVATPMRGLIRTK